jgi:hypothetical protein
VVQLDRLSRNDVTTAINGKRSFPSATTQRAFVVASPNRRQCLRRVRCLYSCSSEEPTKICILMCKSSSQDHITPISACQELLLHRALRCTILSQ